MKKELVLIHGWGSSNYSKNCKGKGEFVAWEERSELITELKKDFNVRCFNLPGFCGVPEPNAEAWDVEDFAKEFDRWLAKQNIKPEFVVGYSFGGAVTLLWKKLFLSATSIVLISPAIFRQETQRSRLGRIGGKLFKDVSWIKHLYLYLFNSYYREGTPFLRKSYDLIARRDLRAELGEAPSGQLLLIYGDNDSATPWPLVRRIVLEKNIPHVVIPGGTHDIGETYPKEIVRAILNFLHKA